MDKEMKGRERGGRREEGGGRRKEEGGRGRSKRKEEILKSP